MLRGIVGGLIGGAIGAVIWTVIVMTTGYEVGFIAWAIGALVGFGVATGTRGDGGAGMGLAAAVIALASIAAGKYIAVSIVFDRYLKENLSDAAISDKLDQKFNDDAAKVWMAKTLITEQEKAGKSVKWPEGYDMELAEKPEHFPKTVWSDVEARWTSMAPDAREQYKTSVKQFKVQQVHDEIQARVGEAKAEGFFATIGLFDILFGVLAVGSAYRIGSGGGD